MKIVYISSSAIPSRAANSIHVMKMCQAFAHNGHHVTLLAPDKKRDYEKDVEDVFEFYGVEPCFDLVRIKMLDIKGRSYLYGVAAARHARSLEPDIVYCRNLGGCFFSLLGGEKVVLEIHSPVEKLGRLQTMMFRSILRSDRLVKLVAITQGLKEYVSQRYSTFDGVFQVAPDGADAVDDGVVPFPIDSGKRLKVGYLGHLFPGRGIDLIVELARQADWADFHIVGGTDEDVAFWREESSNRDNIHIHGFVSPVLAERYRAAFDVLLAPYQEKVRVWGGGGDTARWMSPLKLFEYMASGKAIICSDLPVLREVLSHEVNALLCPPEDIKAWYAALERLTDDEELRRQMGMTAKADFLEHYTWLKRAEALLSSL